MPKDRDSLINSILSEEDPVTRSFRRSRPDVSEQMMPGIDEVRSYANNNPDDPATQSIANQIESKARRISAAGGDLTNLQPRSSFLMDTLDFIDAPRQGVAGIFNAWNEGSLASKGIYGAFREGQTKNITGSDILRQNNPGMNPIARGVLGFAMDTVLDPLTYLTLGGNQLAKGGKALSESGQLVHSKLASSLLESVPYQARVEGHVFDVATNAEEGMRLIDTFQENLKLANKSKGAVAENALAKQADVAEQFNKTTGMNIDDFLSSTGVDLAKDDLLQKSNQLNIGVNVPFLGGIEDLFKGQLGGSNVFTKALNLSKGKDISFATLDADSAVRAVGGVAFGAASKASQALHSTVKALDQVAPVSKVIDPVVGMSKQAVDATAGALHSFKSLFSRKTQVGAEANDLFLNHISARDYNKSVAMKQIKDVLGDEIIRDKASQKEIALAIDALNNQAIQNVAKLEVPEEIADSKFLTDILQKVISNNNFDQTDISSVASILGKRIGEAPELGKAMSMPLDNLLNNAEVPDTVKSGVVKVLSHMDMLNEAERTMGFNYGFQPYYLLHSYLSSARAQGVAGNISKASDFIKARKFDNVKDAFTAGLKDGRFLVSDTSLPDLIYKRSLNSLNLRSEFDFAKRLSLESSISPSALKGLAEEAALDPKGAAAELLRKNKISIHDIDPDLIKEGAKNAKIFDLYSDVAAGGAYNRAAMQSAVDFSGDLEDGIRQLGKLPEDWKLPKAEFGEMGKKVKYGNEEIWLPPHFAKAFDEVTRSKDYLKDLASTSAFGKASLGAVDYTQAAFKKFMTRIFPAFYGQNVISDRLAQVAKGWSHYEPGLFGKAYDVLNGKAVLTTPSGLRWDKASIQRAAKQFGLDPDANKIFEMLDSAGKLDVDKYLNSFNSIGQNIKAGNKLAAFDQAGNKFIQATDNTMRTIEFMHNLQKGHTPAIAAQKANELYVNYSDLTAFERSFAQRFFLFYNYMSKQTKMMLSDVITGPKFIQGQMRGVRGLSEMFSDPNAAPSWDEEDRRLLLSRAALDQITLPIGKDEKGKNVYGRGFNAPLNSVLQQFALFSPRDLSVGEIAGAFGDSATRTIQKAFASSNPILNTTAQLLTGKNLYFDKPLNAEFLRKVPSLAGLAEKIAAYPYGKIPADILTSTDKTLMKDMMGGVEDGRGHYIVKPGWMFILTNLIPGFSRAISTTNTLVDPNLTTAQKAAKGLASVGIESQDLSKTGLYELNSRLDEIMVEQAIKAREKNLKE